jgi:hypothetical protein
VGSGHAFRQQLAGRVEVVLSDQHLDATTRAGPTRPGARRYIGPSTPTLDAIRTEQPHERLYLGLVLNLDESDESHLQKGSPRRQIGQGR